MPIACEIYITTSCVFVDALAVRACFTSYADESLGIPSTAGFMCFDKPFCANFGFSMSCSLVIRSRKRRPL